MKFFKMKKIFTCLLTGCIVSGLFAQKPSKPNIVLIYADDIGIGDFSCYGATEVQTHHTDRLAREGIQFMNAHSAAATCTPSRSLFTVNIVAQEGHWYCHGDGMMVKPNRYTLAKMFTGCMPPAVGGIWVWKKPELKTECQLFLVQGNRV